jgi:hypothetical protein
MNLKKTTLAILLLVLLATTSLFAQTRGGIGGTLHFHGTPVPQGTPLTVLLYADNIGVPLEAVPMVPASVSSSGNFIVWLNPLESPDTAFSHIAVRWTQPYCHTSVVITTPKVVYNNASDTPIFSPYILYAQTTAEPPSNFNEPGAGLSVVNSYLISSLANPRWLSETRSVWGTRTVAYYYKQTTAIDV